MPCKYYSRVISILQEEILSFMTVKITKSRTRICACSLKLCEFCKYCVKWGDFEADLCRILVDTVLLLTVSIRYGVQTYASVWGAHLTGGKHCCRVSAERIRSTKQERYCRKLQHLTGMIYDFAKANLSSSVKPSKSMMISAFSFSASSSAG